MMKNKIYTYLGIVCLTALTGCTATSPANESKIASADVTSSEVSLTLDSDRSKDTAYRDYLKEQIEKSISSIDGITCCSVVLTIDDNNTVTAVSLDYTYDKDVYSGSSLNDLEESFEKYIKGSFETVETVTINGAEENTYDSESDVDISASNDDYVRIKDYTARYFSLLEGCNVTEGYQTIGVHVAFVPEVGSFPIKQEIYQQVAYHALHIWDFYPEVNMFKYDILWDDKAKEPVMTITIDQNAIDNLESYYNSEKMFMEQGEEYAFDNCFTSVEETDETKSWRNTVVIDPNSPVP